MKIDLSSNSISVNFKNGNDNLSDDPFDLNLGVREIRMGGNDAPEFTRGCRTTMGIIFCSRYGNPNYTRLNSHCC